MLLAKILVTPVVITAATLLGRRLGPAFAGWLVAFPLTSGPLSLFIALEQGTAFAAAAAVGSVASMAATVSFAIVYHRVRRRRWPTALPIASTAFAAVGAILTGLPLTLASATLVTAVALVAAQRLIRPGAHEDARPRPLRSDLPARIVVATALVLALTTAAPLLGAFATGLLGGYPLYATILMVFADRAAGPESAGAVARGLVTGLFGFTAFFVVIGLSIVPLGIAAAFALAIATILAVQAAAFVVLRRPASGRPAR